MSLGPTITTPSRIGAPVDVVVIRGTGCATLGATAFITVLNGATLSVLVSVALIILFLTQC
jgi:hypothetical protein